MSGRSALPAWLGWSGRSILSVAVRGRRIALLEATATVQGLRWGKAKTRTAQPEESTADFYLHSIKEFVHELDRPPETLLWTLSRKETLFKRFSLPIAARENLDWVVKNQLKGQLPLPEEKIRFDYRIEESPDRKRLEVSLYAFEADKLELFNGIAEAIGAECAEIRPASMALADGLAEAGFKEPRVVLWSEATEVEGMLLVGGAPADSALGQANRLAATLGEWRKTTEILEIWSEDAETPEWEGGRLADWNFPELPDSAQPHPLATLAALAIANRHRDESAPINLVPESLRPTGRFGMRGVMRLLIAAILVSVLLLGAGVAWKRHAWKSALEERYASLEPAVKKWNSLELRKKTAQARLDAYAQAAPDRVSNIEWMKRVTTLMPKNTWLNRLTLEGDRVELEGFSDAAVKLIPLLEKSGLVRQAGFSAPIVSGGPHGKESFRIRATIVSDWREK